MSGCTRCSSPLPDGYGLARLDDPWSSWDARAELCKPCFGVMRAALSGLHTITTEAMTTPFPVMSRGKFFKVLACNEMYHPSWWSFMDEIETREEWWRILPGDVVLDVGADFGSYALSALAQGAARVFAWSPPFKKPTEAIECATLIASAALNGWTDRLSCVPSGLWSKLGCLAAFDGPRNAEFFATLDGALGRIKGEPGHCAAFPVDTLDALGIEKADWLKIDTEGCELAIMQGGAETIARCRPIVLLEQHYHLDADCEKKADAFLAGLGYEKIGTRPHHTIAHSLYRPGAP
jgi:FkbM family methyltransferase